MQSTITDRCHADYAFGAESSADALSHQGVLQEMDMLRIVTAVLVGVMIGMFIASKVKAEPQGVGIQIPPPTKPGDFGWRHAENHEWYQANMQNCCSAGECRETVAKWEPSGWSAVVDGQWYLVPDAAIKKDETGIPISHPNGKPHICAGPLTKSIWCFSVPNTEM